MDYIELKITILPFSADVSEILIAELAELGYESFMETDTGLDAYIQHALFDFDIVEALMGSATFSETRLQFGYNKIASQNWNAVWESNFDPMFISDKILVRAPFHKVFGNFKHVIEIEPKMSFGTGHHETTSLMMEAMLNDSFHEKSVLDMGCGTGILAILAHQLGAVNITAIDFDEWAFNNCMENFSRNQCADIKAIMGTAEAIPNEQYDIILANINLNVLVSDMHSYAAHLKPGGRIYFSGFYTSDLSTMERVAASLHLDKIYSNSKNNWLVTIFSKPS